MSKIIVVYHAYLFRDHYMDMVSEQFRLLLTSGLFKACDKLYIGVNKSPDMIPANGVEWINNFWSFSSSKDGKGMDSKVEIFVYPDNKEETPTLKWIRDYAKDNPDDYIFYFHTKGITRMNQPTEDWRHYMEYFNIEKWQDCVTKLKEGWDACGVLFNTVNSVSTRSGLPIGVFPHFSGGFWWATGKHINSLKHSFLEEKNRYYREFWVGSNDRSKIFEFHNSTLNHAESLKKGGHYSIEYPRGNYDTNRTLHVICTVYQRWQTLRLLIDCFMVQTIPNWKLYVVHDGEAPQKVRDVINSFKDDRINFTETPQRLNMYGHPNRRMMLEKIQGEKDDFVLITNDDNLYLPVFVEYFLKECNPNTGMVYCDTVHSILKYGVLKTKIKENYVDMGSFMVKLPVAKKVGFKHVHFSADGKYAEECLAECTRQKLVTRYIDKPLFVHC